MMIDDSSSKSAFISVSLLVGAVAMGGWMLLRRGKEIKRIDKDTWESKIPKHYGVLKEIWPGFLYVLEADGCSQGPPMRNMIIYRAPFNQRHRLVIFNGIAVRDDTLAEIQALGEPSVLVVPNSLHRDCAEVWKDRFPNMLVVCPKAAVEKVSKVVSVDMTTQEWAISQDWNKLVQALEIDGWNPFETILEFDVGQKKKAFVVADLLFTVPYDKNAGLFGRFMFWLFDCCIAEPVEGEIVIPKVSRVARLIGIADWKKASAWYRTYAKEQGSTVAVIAVGHGAPIIEINTKDGCALSFDGVADQLMKPRW